MSDDPLNKNNSERATALLGLLAQTGTGDGPAPSAGELSLYLDGGVGEERTAQIKSHIAHNPDVFSMVLERREARKTASETKAEAPDTSDNVVPLKRSAPSKAVWWGGGALAASVMLVAMVFFANQATEPQERQRIAQRHPSTAPTAAEQQAAYMREGYRYGQAESLSGEQISLVGGCGENCTTLESSLIRFGALVRSIEQTCQTSGAVSTSQRNRLEALVAGENALTQAPWASYARNLHNAAERSDDTLCQAIGQLSANLK